MLRSVMVASPLPLSQEWFCGRCDDGGSRYQVLVE
jgi:hypothetical protein